MRFFNFFLNHIVQKYQNEISPILYYGISTKTNEKDLKVPNSQTPWLKKILYKYWSLLWSSSSSLCQLWLKLHVNAVNRIYSTHLDLFYVIIVWVEWVVSFIKLNMNYLQISSWSQEVGWSQSCYIMIKC